MERSDVRRWVDGYERAWRSAGTDRLGELFTDDATYLVSPWARPVEGLSAVRELWEAERDGPDDVFTMTSEVVAVEGDDAVVRVEVDYTGASPARWRDLWVLRFDGAGRCRSFEEWPFAPERRDGH
jgi:ketosteroid isomerase-like protein